MTAVARSLMFVVTSLDRGGADAQVADIAVGLKRRGWRVSVVSLLHPRAHVDRLQGDGVEVASLGMSPGIPDPRGAIRLWRLVRERRVDVLHGHMYHANMLTRPVGRAAGVPAVVSTIHSVREGGRLRELAYRVTDRLADVTTAVSHAAGDYYCQVGAVSRMRLRILPNGVDFRRFDPFPESASPDTSSGRSPGEFHWIAVGRLDPLKDLPTLLRAMGLLTDPVSGWSPRLMIVGGGPLKRELEDLARELGLGGSVSFLGFRDDVAELLRSADAFVMSSEVEGLPMALLEASACGLPIVATDVGGNREIVVDGRTGLLVPPGDPEALASAMEQLMADERSRTMGVEGRKWTVERYGLDAVLDRWEALYNELLVGL